LLISPILSTFAQIIFMNTRIIKTLFSIILAGLFFSDHSLLAQQFYFGADLSYVNELEDCGVTYHEAGVEKDVYEIFSDNGCNIVRLRLWHTPAWYDTLNAGNRYSDFSDVRNSIQRAKSQNMKVLLDFHLSDFWADPSRQLCPAAWLGVVDNLPVLKDSLYRYISQTLSQLDSEGLLPEMVQIGNETNRGIMLSPSVDAAGWSLDWNRNSQLFNTAIQAVRDVESSSGKAVKVALHIAGPADAGWLMQGFWSHGVTDFDVIGISYYWAWHMPTSITDAGNVVAQLLQQYPGKEVMIFETGYIWTTQSNDNAANIISQVHPEYAPASPDNQRRWLIDMTQAVIDRGATGVFYWEPAWVSSNCHTPWGQGSHQEHATFFDFQNNMLPTGGMKWMGYPFENLVSTQTPDDSLYFEVTSNTGSHTLKVQVNTLVGAYGFSLQLMDMAGKVLNTEKLVAPVNGLIRVEISLPELTPGIYYAVLLKGTKVMGMRGFTASQ
jgi:arabinogalactan endo-1,4-beta-galactosidase